MKAGGRVWGPVCGLPFLPLGSGGSSEPRGAKGLFQIQKEGHWEILPLLIWIHSGFKQSLWVFILKSLWPFCKCFVLIKAFRLQAVLLWDYKRIPGALMSLVCVECLSTPFRASVAARKDIFGELLPAREVIAGRPADKMGDMDVAQLVLSVSGPPWHHHPPKYSMCSVLQYLSKIKVQQIEKDRGEWDSLSPEARREKESSLQMFGQLARFHNIMSNETIGTLAFLTSGRQSGPSCLPRPTEEPCQGVSRQELGFSVVRSGWNCCESANCCFPFQKSSLCLCILSLPSASSPCSTTSCNTWLGLKWEL